MSSALMMFEVSHARGTFPVVCGAESFDRRNHQINELLCFWPLPAMPCTLSTSPSLPGLWKGSHESAKGAPRAWPRVILKFHSQD